MQVARPTQDYYGFFRQPALSRKDTATDKPGANRSRPSVLPAERVVEGELLRNNRTTGSEAVDQFIQRSRFTQDAANSADSAIGGPGAQRAISAYLDNASATLAGAGGASRTIDYYV